MLQNLFSFFRKASAAPLRPLILKIPDNLVNDNVKVFAFQGFYALPDGHGSLRYTLRAAFIIFWLHFLGSSARFIVIDLAEFLILFALIFVLTVVAGVTRRSACESIKFAVRMTFEKVIFI